MVSGSTGKAYHHGNVREAALTAALERLRKCGHVDLSVRAIAADIDVTHGALYRYFRNRDALLDALGTASFDLLADRLDRASDQRSFVGAYVGFAVQEPRLYEVAMSRKHAAVRSDDRLEAAVQRVINAAVRTFGAADDDDEATKLHVMRVWTMLHGALGLHFAGVLEPRNDDQLLDLVLDLAELNDGLRTAKRP
ncbi:MAG: TetR/AcrR family transcriptional regulator [Erythrobacter sp.]